MLSTYTILYKLSDQILSKTSFYSFSKYSRPTHFCHLHGSFCIPSADHKAKLPLSYRFTAELKVACASYLFPASLYSVLETNKRCRGQCLEGGTKIAKMKECISSDVDDVFALPTIK